MEPVKVQNPQRVQQGATPRLCVVYTAKDSMRTLPRSIASVRLLADRIIVLDSGSVDGTIDASRALGAEVVHQDWLGYARQKQRAIDLAAGSEFVLLLDSDEIPDERLLEAIRSAMKSPGNIQGWWIDRRFWFAGGYVRIGSPDRVLRLFRTGAGSIPEREVHEVVVVAGPTARLSGLCRHESWVDLDDALSRQLRYARLAASIPGARSNLRKLLINPPWAFFRHYILCRSIFDGWRGFLLSIVIAAGTLEKHLLILAKDDR